jgi:hypothetical protein
MCHDQKINVQQKDFRTLNEFFRPLLICDESAVFPVLSSRSVAALRPDH